MSEPLSGAVSCDCLCKGFVLAIVAIAGGDVFYIHKE
jgi:hypothetical protein